MTAFEKMKTVRSNGRPSGLSYVRGILRDTVFFHGDRRYADDSAIVAGIGYLNEEMPVTFAAIEKGVDVQDRIKRNFGCPKPEGYRKALRMMKQAEKFGRPILCFVDTLGAYCGIDAEERGQGQAISENIAEMFDLHVPIITTVIGEGGSGGALALGVADRVYMLENAIYSVISPEGCASIVWKDSSMAPAAAERLRITSSDMVEFEVAEGVFKEDFVNFDKMCSEMRVKFTEDILELKRLPIDELLDERYNRYRKIGIYTERTDMQ